MGKQYQIMISGR